MNDKIKEEKEEKEKQAEKNSEKIEQSFWTVISVCAGKRKDQKKSREKWAER